MICDIGRVLRQYVTDDLLHRAIALFTQSLIDLKESFSICPIDHRLSPHRQHTTNECRGYRICSVISVSPQQTIGPFQTRDRIPSLGFGKCNDHPLRLRSGRQHGTHPVFDPLGTFAPQKTQFPWDAFFRRCQSGRSLAHISFLFAPCHYPPK